MMPNMDFYAKHQRELLWFVNSKFGRRYLKIDSPLKTVGVFPNGVVFKDRRKLQFRFYTFPLIEQKLAPYIKIAKLELPSLFKLPQIELIKAISLATFSVGAGGGDVRRNAIEAWGTIRNNTAGTGVRDTSSDAFARMHAINNGGGDFELGRVSLITDTSALSDGANIESATYTVVSSSNTITDTYKYCLVGNTQSSDTSLATGDYDLLQGSALDSPTEYCTRVDVSGASQTATLTLNASGLAAISTTTYTKMALRSNMDVDNSAPTGSNAITITWGSTFLTVNVAAEGGYYYMSV